MRLLPRIFEIYYVEFKIIRTFLEVSDFTVLLILVLSEDNLTLFSLTVTSLSLKTVKHSLYTTHQHSRKLSMNMQ
jgi:hypothetical protein